LAIRVRYLPVTDNTFREVLQDAVQMELAGMRFFERAAQAMTHPRAKQMFLNLAKQERRHVSVLETQLGRISGGMEWATLEEAMSAPSSGASIFDSDGSGELELRPEAGELEVIEIGMRVEKKSIDYYRSAGARSEDPKAKETFDWLVEEETGHLTILKAEYDNRSGSGFYYDDMEFSLETQ